MNILRQYLTVATALKTALNQLWCIHRWVLECEWSGVLRCKHCDKKHKENYYHMKHKG